jgi:hypothetical protein
MKVSYKQVMMLYEIAVCTLKFGDDTVGGMGFPYNSESRWELICEIRRNQSNDLINFCENQDDK